MNEAEHNGPNVWLEDILDKQHKPQININKLLTIESVVAIVCVIVALLPLMFLGRYNHALGDDYTYGQFSKTALDNGNIFDALQAAVQGTVLQYKIWQGTYSAMFLMHIPPNGFGDFFYKLYPTILLSCLVSSVYILLYPIVTKIIKASKKEWIIISSVIALMFIEQVPLMGEAFYWYNGSMYYTGFFALTLTFFGLYFSFLLDEKTSKIVILSVIGVLIAGANYASLLPAFLILSLIILSLFFKKATKKKINGSIIIMSSTLCGFAVSVLAPGNALRQDTSYGTTPIRAILKSLYQAFNYLRGWNSVWLYLGLAILTPLFIAMIKRMDFNFRLPLLFVIFFFGVLASASCPTFYAQNNGGAARVFDLSWYMLVLFIYSSWFYVLGWCTKHIKMKEKHLYICSYVAIMIIFGMFAAMNYPSSTYMQLNSVKAFNAISNGDAAYYEEQYQARKQMLASDTSDCVFAPYDVPNSIMYVLYLGDLSEDVNAEVNKAYAKFYNKNSVRIEE